MRKLKYHIINELTEEIVFTGEASDVEDVWKEHFEEGEYKEHYLLVWEDGFEIANHELN
jgi:hypothetical protein